MNGIYIRRPDKKKRNIATAIVILVVAFFSLVVFSDRITNVSLGLIRPFQAAVWNVSNSVFSWTFSLMEAGDLKGKIDALTDDKEKLTAEIVKLRDIRQENEQLRQALNLGLDKDFNLVMASVSGKDVLNDTIVIDRGLNDGVAEGMAVVTENRVTVGRVSKSFEDFSRVFLVTNKESVFEAEVQGRNLVGLVKGSGNSTARLTLIPKDKEISEGDALITTSLSDSFPRGLFIGLVREVKNTNSESFQEAEIAPFFNIRRLGRVFIITNQK